MDTWHDTELGLFTFDEYAWVKEFKMSVFLAFKYAGYGTGIQQTGRPNFDLLIEAENKNEIPSQPLVEVARLTISNLERLVKEGIVALYNDFIGNGPNSGMWWHSCLEDVRKDIINELENEALCKLEEAGDLYTYMGNPSVFVQSRGYGYKYPCAVISFSALFEVEHGIGMLTDGNTILGVGYEMSVSPFE